MKTGSLMRLSALLAKHEGDDRTDALRDALVSITHARGDGARGLSRAVDEALEILLIELQNLPQR